tara:strand:- start:2480 stop:3139 length:660 start_codon:yes stop_codon:yes gene_type:complete
MIDCSKIKNTVKSSYEISDDMKHFIINSKQEFITVSDKKKNQIIEYSQKDKSNIVKIYELTVNKCISEFYKDLSPMVIIEKNNFYDSQLFLKKSKEYAKFICDFERVSELYNKIVDSYIMFIKTTGCYFNDMSGNNIMVNFNFSEFKIIDVFSIKQAHKGMLIYFDPWSIMSCVNIRRENDQVYVVGDDTLSSYLSHVNLNELNSNVFKKIETRKFKVE